MNAHAAHFHWYKYKVDYSQHPFPHSEPPVWDQHKSKDEGRKTCDFDVFERYSLVEDDFEQLAHLYTHTPNTSHVYAV